MSLTDVVAWWGAVIATGVLVWDVIKWRLSGPKLRLTVRSGPETIGAVAHTSSMSIIAEVVNYGNGPTTLTSLSFLFYKNSFHRLLNHPDGIIPGPDKNTRYTLPHEL